MPGIDLHCHTTASDGLSAPAHLVRLAAERELDAIAVTDHDTMSGLSEASAESASAGVRVIPGIELSTRADDRSVHVLGYFLDPSHPGLAREFDAMRRERMERAHRIVAKLNDLGYELEIDEVLSHAGGDVVARPHIARAMVARGYITTTRDAFTQELIADGGQAYIGRRELTPTEAIRLINSADGVAVLAHPGVAHHGGPEDPVPTELIERLHEQGLVGLEVDHPDQPPLVRDRLRELAERLDLVTTGGSDFHGERGRGLGTCTTSVENLDRLEARAASR